MTNLEQLENEINNIKDRNIKVEADKAWETSLFRKIAIAFLTYLVITIFFFFAGFNRPFLSAIVPTVGFILSTLSLSYLKTIWIKYYYAEKRK
ncbi:MAG: hypothetical protein Q7R92_03830 [bacterium]|nr:hypothetical protein [bacterium]